VTIRRNRDLRWLSRAAIICCMTIGLTSAVFADDSAPETNEASLSDNGIEETNEAYDYTVETGKGVGASAGISSGGWSSLGSKLSYMKFPEGVTSPNGDDGLWCYCIDISTDTKDGHKYAITTLDAANYYEPEAGDKIRSILLNSYPNKTLEELASEYGLEELMEEEAFMATQWILWYYSNPEGQVDAGGGNYYPADIYKPSDYTRETVTMWYDDENGKEARKQSSNIVKLAKALDQLTPAAAYETEPAEIIIEKKESPDKVIFDYSGSKELSRLKNISISVKDGSGKEVPYTCKGHTVIVQKADVSTQSDSIQLTVEISAEQDLAKDVYFFSPEGGRNASQSRVAAYEGTAPVAAVEVFSLTAYDPGEAKEPEESVKESGDPFETINEEQDDSPKTGDGVHVLMLILLMITALAAAAAMLSTNLSTEKPRK